MARSMPIRSWLLGLLLVLGCEAAAQAVCDVDDKVRLLHFNDLHGQLAPLSSPGEDPPGGLARLATLVSEARSEVPGQRTLLLFAGDLLQGSLSSSLFMGHPDLVLLERIGVDAAVVGNHEFDFGQENFRALAQASRFPFLSANLQAQPEPLPVRPSLVIRGSGGPTIAILGLTTSELLTTTHPRNTKGIQVADPIEVARALVPQLRARADLVVVLSHLGLAADRRLAGAVEGIDVIVGGHDHHVLQPPVIESGTLIVQGGSRGQWLGRLEIECAAGRLKPKDYRLIPVSAEVAEAPEIAAEVARVVAEADRGMDEVIGDIAVDLSADRGLIRRGEAVFGDFVADLALTITDADVALVNAGSFRASIPKGGVTLKQVYEALPFGNELVVAELSGQQIREALARSAALEPQDNPGGFLQVSGLSYVIAGNRLDAVTLSTGALDPSERYRVVMPDFLASGGDGYAMLMSQEGRVSTGRRLADVVVAAIRAGSEIPDHPDGRILRRTAASVGR
ncbi:bifunctional metallophosphatase/5'-nucleotidase [Thiorhodococcus minor]|uniref:Bifunctional metallophosphatase/5'-nucleotidase n=1 Tax=Thiorhodococcus minor TaxID=57489 RepID=A0A6M0K199_9GAMM|nr:bifunctional UDP-sugar hydrolase/5'-nucleotidase [Thiorhodococcus minor]NEV62673.1 bifunctional metallophosphatase/5'-nucleotidase [Thiorhodococcus minor]